MAQDLMDPVYRSELVGRIESLQPDSRRLWGKMTCQQMLCHLTDQLRVALGDQPIRDVSNVLSRSLIKWLVIYSPMKAPRGKIQTVPEMLTTETTEWQADRDRLLELVERMATAETFYPHPFFGPLSRKDWGHLGARHFHHHLQQFGV